MSKRGQNEGTVRRRADGRWEARITVNGRQRSSYAPTRDAASQRMRAPNAKRKA